MMKVLIVDDQAGWRNFHTEAVSEVLGKNIILDIASSAQEGYSKLLESKDVPYNFMLTDMQMEENYAPKMAGEWLIEQAKNLPFCYATKIIIISASPKIKYIADNYDVDFIPKSVAITSIEPYKELLRS